MIKKIKINNKNLYKNLDKKSLELWENSSKNFDKKSQELWQKFIEKLR